MSITRKFRGKRKDNGEWVKGFYVESKHYDEGVTLHRIISEDVKYCDYEGYYIEYDVDPETVGQYIGICDINETEIFEGDIIKFSGEYWVVKHGIFYDNGFSDSLYGYYIELIGEKVCRFGIVYDPKNGFEVVGNVYDNPELLKGGAE